MPKLIDMTGRVCGRLTVISKVPIEPLARRGAFWNCVCDCGKAVAVHGKYLRTGHTMSCGCLQRDRASEANTTHGRSRVPCNRAYRSWSSMLGRCMNPNEPCYGRYGGRGIAVCERWRKFEHFFADMGPCPEGLTLDRRNNEGNYNPCNCRWATRTQQARNRRSSHIITHNGKSLCIAEWSEVLEWPYYIIQNRLRYGWSAERALSTPVRGR